MLYWFTFLLPLPAGFKDNVILDEIEIGKDVRVLMLGKNLRGICIRTFQWLQDHGHRDF